MIQSLLLTSFSLLILTFSSVDRVSFYQSFESNSKQKIEQQIEQLSKYASSTLVDAYLGAITMKSAQFEKTPKDKATVFKKGSVLLENAISKEPKNGEFRFLRLVIQENSPKILKYNKNMQEDAEIVVSSFKSLNSTVKSAIRNYAEHSSLLNLNDLK